MVGALTVEGAIDILFVGVEVEVVEEEDTTYNAMDDDDDDTCVVRCLSCFVVECEDDDEGTSGDVIDSLLLEKDSTLVCENWKP